MVAKYAIEHWTRIPCEVELASEFRYRDPIVGPTTLVVAISQSGETADTLMAIRHAKEQHARVLAVCNTNGSTIPRESDAVIYTHAGPEIGVASTKGFLTQVVACYLLGLYLAQVRGTKFDDEIANVMAELATMPDAIAARPRGHGPGAQAGRRLRRGAGGAVPGPPRRLPGRARGRAQAQGAGVHPRRGLRRRRAQARPDRADRGRACPSSSSSRRAGATCCTTRSCPTCRRSAPAAPGRSSSPRPTTTRSCRTPTSSSRCPGSRPCCSPWSPPSPCRCSPASSRRRRATTSTSPATSPSPSPSSDARLALPLGSQDFHVNVKLRYSPRQICRGQHQSPVVSGVVRAGEAGRDRRGRASTSATSNGSGRRWSVAPAWWRGCSRRPRRSGPSPRSPPASRPRRRWPRRSAPRRACRGRTPRSSPTTRAGRTSSSAGPSPRRSRRPAITSIHVSLSHDAGIASAVVICEG